MLPLDFASAQTVNRDMQKEAAIWSQLHDVAPDLVETFKEATIKMDKEDYLGAAVLYQKVVDAAPRFDAGLRRLGTSLASAGQTEQGLRFLEKAVELNRSAANLSEWAQFLRFEEKA
jgi:tetratricopeptide (TPR) repeat protein